MPAMAGWALGLGIATILLSFSVWVLSGLFPPGKVWAAAILIVAVLVAFVFGQLSLVFGMRSQWQVAQSHNPPGEGGSEPIRRTSLPAANVSRVMFRAASVLFVVVIGSASACGFKATGHAVPTTSPLRPSVTVAKAPSQDFPEVPSASQFSPGPVDSAPSRSPGQVTVSRPPSPTHLPTPAPTPRPSPNRATGTATFVNHCGADLVIRQGMQVAAGSTVFDLLQTATIPSNGSVSISIRAVQAGEPGNVAAGAVNTVVGGTFPCLSVYNASPTTGGTD